MGGLRDKQQQTKHSKKKIFRNPATHLFSFTLSNITLFIESFDSANNAEAPKHGLLDLSKFQI